MIIKVTPAVQIGGSYWGGASVIRQDRRVQVEAPVPRNVENRLAEDAPVGSNDEQVGIDRSQLRADAFIPECFGLDDRNVELAGRFPGRRRHQPVAATGRPIGLADHHAQFEPGIGSEHANRRHGV
jgi:hypothetical protein